MAGVWHKHCETREVTCSKRKGAWDPFTPATLCLVPLARSSRAREMLSGQGAATQTQQRGHAEGPVGPHTCRFVLLLLSHKAQIFSKTCVSIPRTFEFHPILVALRTAWHRCSYGKTKRESHSGTTVSWQLWLALQNQSLNLAKLYV